MKDKRKIIEEIRLERYYVERKLIKLQELKYKRTYDYIKLGSIMCSMLDVQENIMKSYIEILSARINYLYTTS